MAGVNRSTGGFPEHSPWESSLWVERSQSILDSYRHWLGEELISRTGSATEVAQRLFDSPRVVVAHGLEVDPVLCYGNRCALELWEMTLAELLVTPSRLTAEPLHRDEWARLLQRTRDQGYVDDYRGIRVSRTGRRFLIERAIVWNLRDSSGKLAGQAATFAEWTPLPGAVGNDQPQHNRPAAGE
ncbi:MAG: MEKHLA domain-containing protein [Planctomycetaceae bacterium]